MHLLPGEHGEIWGRLEVGWEKMAFWSTKAAISLKRVKIRKTLLWEAYRNLPSLFRTVLPQIPYGLPFPRLGLIGIPTSTKTPIAFISGTGKGTNFRFGHNNNRVHPNKSP